MPVLSTPTTTRPGTGASRAAFGQPRTCNARPPAAAAAAHAARPDGGQIRGRFHGPPAPPPATRAVPAGHGDASAGAPRYRRVLLKLSGEGLAGEGGMGVDPAVLKRVAVEIAAAVARGVEVAIVVGGGNYYRGAADVVSAHGVDRATGDYVGMLATVMNAVLLQGALEREGVPTRVQTAIEMRQVAEPYIRRRAMRHLERGRVVIFGAGTGNPFFTTDTAAALRAAEIGADAVLKATKVDGVYDRDPMAAAPGEAVLLDRVSYAEVRAARLAVMDETATTLADDNGIEAVVFNMLTPGHVTRALCGEAGVGTAVHSTNGGGNGGGGGGSGGGQAGDGKGGWRPPAEAEGPCVGC